MKYFSDFADERLRSSCIQCGEWSGDIRASNDHVPSKSLLRRPLPDNSPIVKICAGCNNSFAGDEEYMSLFLNCVMVGSTDPARHVDSRVSRALRHQKKLRGRIENSRTIDDEGRCVWVPEFDRINRVVVKNARGHASYECRQPILAAPEYVWVAPLQTMMPLEREEFEKGSPIGNLAGWPEVGSRMMIRLVEGHDLRDGWVAVQENVYRYRVEQNGWVMIRSVLFEYLATEVYWNES